MFKHLIFFFLTCFLFIACYSNSPTLRPDEYFTIDYPIVHDKWLPAFDSFNSICPTDMVYIQKLKLCVDKFEAPNKEGALAYYGMDYYAAKNYCESNNKRLLTEKEWEYITSNGFTTIYPYGNSYQRGMCNDNKSGYQVVPWGKMFTSEWPSITKKLTDGKINPSGSHQKCQTKDGIFDLTGNVAEIVENPERQYGFAVKGCFFYGCYGGQMPTYAFANFAHPKSFSSYEFSTRCKISIK